MPKFVQDNITEQTQHPSPPAMGLNFPKADTLAAEALAHPIGSINYAEIAKTLLAEAGVDVDFKREGLWYTFEGLPEDALELAQMGAEKRLSFAKELFEYANDRLENNKTLLPKVLAEYGRKLGIEHTDMESIFERRISPIKEVVIKDWILSADPFDMGENTRGAFSPTTGILSLTAGAYRKDRDGHIDWRASVDKTLNHELEHALSYTGISDMGEVARSGLVSGNLNEKGRLLVVGSHGGLLMDEGYQEYVLWKGIKLTDTPTYEVSVMTLAMLFSLDPSLERTFFEAKFLGKEGARGEAVGKIERLLGPNAVEIIEQEAIPAMNMKLRALPEYKDTVAALLDRDNQHRGRELLDAAQLEIFVPKGLGYSDEQFREFARTGINLGDPKYK